jgi:peptidase S41-like protein
MRLQAALVLFLVTVVGSASADVGAPRSPAGRVLSAMLDALNSGDRARVTAYVKKYQPNRLALIDRMLDIRRETGGFNLVRIEHAEPLAIDFVISAKAEPTTWLAHLEVTDARSPRIVELHRDEIPRGMTVAQMHFEIDAATRARVLDGVTRRLAEWYVYPDDAKKMVESLRAHQALGEYDTITDGRKLARAINDALHAVTPDSHLSVECTPEMLPTDEGEPPPLDLEHPVDERFRADMLRDNCGFEKVDRLEGNVGYLKLNFLGPPAVCGPKASEAMNLLAHVDALIVDVRDNGGGAPRMVAWLSSYLFDARTHLNDQYERRRNKTTEFWTRVDVPGPRLGGKVPVYVLTARRTFSGAEELTYDLKYLKRATIVGENTGGGAHLTAPLRVDDHFLVRVPYARAVNPITKTDWEGTGVAPDVDVAADQALDVARKLAADAIRNRASPPPAVRQ